jgi:membrane protease YdiL (CAAX protease family)
MIKNESRQSIPGLGTLFVNEQGWRVPWRVAIFIAIYQAMHVAGFALLQRWNLLAVELPLSPTACLIQEGWELLCVATATGVMAKLEHRALLSFGFIDRFAWVRLLGGAICGLACLSTVIGFMSLRGLVVFDGRALDAAAAWRYALEWALICLVIGAFEESLLRGYLQHTLGRALGFWPAAWLLSIAFALWHLDNAGESLFGLFVVGAGGLVFCLSLWYTRSLCWAVGFHAGWDWGQSYLYGTPDSGVTVQGHLFITHAVGDPLWSGGSTGPEGSLVMLPLLAVMAIGMWVWWGRKGGDFSRETRR